jgi:hypothetical protein|tara:strand:+ start:3440 stop:4000 length:561 start_codon:yes stop_codon:yes gene_type:complete
MKFNKTVQVMQKLGKSVVTGGRAILKKRPSHTTSVNTLYKDFKYTVESNDKSVRVFWTFGGAEEYWDFVNQGVKGSGGFKGSGKMRGQGSPYSFKGKNIARGVIKKWIAYKPLKLRNKKGQFIEKSKANIKSAEFLIGRAIAQRGLTRTLFFDTPYNKEFKKYENKILQAFADDLEEDMQNNLDKD